MSEVTIGYLLNASEILGAIEEIEQNPEKRLALERALDLISKAIEEIDEE